LPFGFSQIFYSEITYLYKVYANTIFWKYAVEVDKFTTVLRKSLLFFAIAVAAGRQCIQTFILLPQIN